MNCLDFRDQYLAYVDQTLPRAAQSAAEGHLAVCGQCARHDLAMRRGLLVLRNLPSVEPSDTVTISKEIPVSERTSTARSTVERSIGPGL